MSFWGSEADLLAADKDGFVKEQTDKIAQLVAGPPQITNMEVATES